MAASHKDEKAVWGKWNAFKNSIFKDGISKEEALEITL